MIHVYISDATEEFLLEVNSNLEEFIKYYITIQEDHDENYRFQGLFPNFLFRTNPKKCEEIIRELLEYSLDKFPHTLTPLHEYALFQIIRYCEESYLDFEVEKEQREPALFNLIEIDNNDDESDLSENGGYTLEDFHTFDFYYNNIFQDLDFLDVDFYYKIFVGSPQFFYESANINLDAYVDLMPSDIKIDYLRLTEIYIRDGINKKQDKTTGKQDEKVFSEHVKTILSVFRFNLEHRGAYRLMWNDDNSPRNEKAIQSLFLLQISDYCEENDIDISRENNIGRGPVDFKLSRGHLNKVLIEVKLASNSKKNHGVNKQLIQYMISEKIKNAMYLVICFTKEEYKKAEDLSGIIDKINVEYNISITLELIDVTNKKEPASQLPNGHKFNYIVWD